MENLSIYFERMNLVFISSKDLVEEHMKNWRGTMCRLPLGERKLISDDVYEKLELEERERVINLYNTDEKRFKRVERIWKI